MTLLDPVWLALAVPLGLSLWLWPPPTRLLLALRLLLLALVVLSLAGLAVYLPSRAGTVVVVADRSASMPPDSAAAQKEVVDLLQAAMGAEDRLAVVSFGRSAVLDRPPAVGAFAGFSAEVGRNASNLDEGLKRALDLVPRGAPGKLLVLSDGRWTGHDPAEAAALAAARGVAIDYRPLSRPAANDLAVARVDAPSQVAPGERFLLTAWVRSPTAQTVSFELRRGKQRIAAGERQLQAGLNRLTFRDRADEAGNQAYTLTVTGSGNDPVPENNRARLLVGVGGPRPLLHVARSRDSALARLLSAGGLRLQLALPEECDWTLESLARYSAVLLEDVPAETIGNAGMETLAAWVRATGAGLMMTGGRSSYGPGGYYKSPLEPVLPVSMELRNEHRKLSMAIVVALDRSGSMAIPVSGGKVKMDLANLGTVQVLDLMGPMDEFGCLAIDSVPHVVAELGPVKNKAKLRDDVLRIHSEGGGIFIYEALAAAAKMLLPAKAGTRHIILFADAMDSEEPGKYRELLDNCQKAGITVSVIGLGKPTDKDADLLRDIAARGKGRIFFTDKPEELPRLFAQDTFVVARNTFLDEPTPVQATPGLTALTGRAFAVDRPVGGYNLCYLRPGATLATVTLDEYKAPLVAAWQAGTGRVLCYTGEADGKYTGAIARWPQVGDYFTSLARWTAGQPGALPGNMLLTQEVKNGVQVVQLHLDPDRKGEPFQALPGVSTLRSMPGAGPETRRSSLRWSGPDTLTAEFPLEGGETVLATVEVPGHGPIPLPPACLPYSPEYRPAEAGSGLPALERLARATGGKERVEVPGIWQELPRHPRLIRIAPWLLSLAVLLLLLEVLERRTGLLALPRRLRRQAEPARVAKRTPPLRAARQPAPASPSPAPANQPAEEKSPLKPAAAQPAEGPGVLEALRKARQRSRGRLD